jgi:hypothetical protein
MLKLAHIVAHQASSFCMLFGSISLQPFAPEAPCVAGDKIHCGRDDEDEMMPSVFGERAQVIARLEAGITALLAGELTRRVAYGRHALQTGKPGFGPGFPRLYCQVSGGGTRGHRLRCSRHSTMPPVDGCSSCPGCLCRYRSACCSARCWARERSRWVRPRMWRYLRS